MPPVLLCGATVPPVLLCGATVPPVLLCRATVPTVLLCRATVPPVLLCRATMPPVLLCRATVPPVLLCRALKKAGDATEKLCNTCGMASNLLGWKCSSRMRYCSHCVCVSQNTDVGSQEANAGFVHTASWHYQM